MGDDNSAIELPEAPEGTQFEELVAAVLQSSGLFVEKNLKEYTDKWHDYGKDPVLELDVITTSYEDDVPNLTLVEAKSGTNWGFTEVFKVRGWMEYLDIPNGLLIVSEDNVDFDKYVPVSDDLNVPIVNIPNANRYRESLKDITPDMEDVLEIDVESWRFIYWMERELIGFVKNRRYSDDGGEVYSFRISDYADAISNDIFFADTITSRIDRLYESHSEYRNISAKTGHEMEHGEYPDEAEEIPNPVFEKTLLGTDINPVQTALMLEQQARVSLLKAAVEYTALEEAGEEVGPNVEIMISGNEYTFPVYTFPDTFENAINEISDKDNYRKYPVFWKFFTGIFGGFILEDYEDEEYEHLSALTGVPIDEVPAALDAFSEFFPLPGGDDWIVDFGNLNLRGLRLFPTPVRGIGANYRRLLYAEEDSYKNLELEKDYTLQVLMTWHQSAYKVLNGDFPDSV